MICHCSGETSTTVDAQWVTDQSFLLISPRANIESRSLWWERGTDNFTIHMDKERSNDTDVAWLVVDHSS